MNFTLADTIYKGMNNPECSFFVGQTLGYANASYLIVRVALIYFGLRLFEKILFKGIPKFYHWWMERRKKRRGRK